MPSAFSTYIIDAGRGGGRMMGRARSLLRGRQRQHLPAHCGQHLALDPRRGGLFSSELLARSLIRQRIAQLRAGATPLPAEAACCLARAAVEHEALEHVCCEDVPDLHSLL